MGGSAENTPSPDQKTPKRTTIPQPFHFHLTKELQPLLHRKMQHRIRVVSRKEDELRERDPIVAARNASQVNHQPQALRESDQRAATRVKPSEHLNETYVSLAESTEASIKGCATRIHLKEEMGKQARCLVHLNLSPRRCCRQSF
jgi:hypothetical protein